jgi:hypothetical protein
MLKNSINAEKCGKIPLMQKNAENSKNAEKFHYECFVIPACINPS